MSDSACVFDDISWVFADSRDTYPQALLGVVGSLSFTMNT